jgi:hypothetical protein
MLFISMEIYYDKLPPHILSVGTTANSPLRLKGKADNDRYRKNSTLALDRGVRVHALQPHKF